MLLIQALEIKYAMNFHSSELLRMKLQINNMFC